MCIRDMTLGLHEILELRDCKRLLCSLCNKDIQVIYTPVYLGWNLQDQIILATFH